MTRFRPLGWSNVAEPLTAEEKSRRKRAAELMGEVLPTLNGDDRPEGWNERPSTTRDDELRRDVPPHHG